MQYVDVIVGGQYGSEAKGHVTAQVVKSAAMDAARDDTPEVDIYNVRVAGPNAGHTVIDANGEKFALRQIPVGAVVDESVKLYIAPGSEVDPEVLFGEIAQITAAGYNLTGRLFISKQATVIDQEHKDREAALVGAVGSTGKGIGAARADRLMRVADTMGDRFGHLLNPWEWAEPEDLYATDDIVHNEFTHVIIEGTQGYGLSLRASGHYPQVTSSDARAIDFLAMAGVDPTRCNVETQTWVVARVFPIRVAGNSGPMEGETTWDALGLPEERTTVTQKVRRVGEWDPELVKRAIQANGGHNVNLVITMLDQVIPELATMEYDPEDIDPEHPGLVKANEWTQEYASDLGAPVAAITFGPDKLLFTDQAMRRRQGGGLESADGIQGLIEQMLGGAVIDGR